MMFRNQFMALAFVGVTLIPQVRATQIDLSFYLTEFGNPGHVVTGSASLNGTAMGADAYHATGGTVTVNGIAADSGLYNLLPVGPSWMLSPSGAFLVDNMVYTVLDPHLDYAGLLGFHASNGVELNIWGVSPGVYSVYAWTPGSGYSTTFTGAGSMSVSVIPDGGASLVLLGSALGGLAVLKRKTT